MRLTRVTRAASLALAAVLLAAACGGDGEDDAATGPVELTFWTWAPEMDKVVAAWNEKHPDIKVTVDKQDGGDPAVTKLLTAVRAGSGAPDIMQAEYQKIPTLVSADAIVDLSDVLGDDVEGRFAPSTWQAVTLGTDAVYGVPQDSGPMFLFYRDDVFQQLGLKPPATWDEYAAAARRIHQANPQQYLGTFSSNDPGWFAGLSQQAGASWWGIDGETWSVDIDAAPTQKVADFWGGLVAEGVIDNKPMYTPEWNAALNKGTQVGWLSAIWAPGVLVGSAPSTAGKWRMAPMPQWDATPATGAWGGSATSITSQSKAKKQAAEFITWLNTDPAAVDALVGTANLYPAATAGQESLGAPPGFFSNQPDFWQVAAQVAPTVRDFVYGPNVNVTYNTYNDAFGKAASSRSAAAFGQALTTMQSTTVDDLEKTGFKVAP
jgi:multiple sugar transport system substrate-binding protein